MKIVLNIIRIIVGALFIFSGLVKANDPLSLSYKMKEFFEIWNSDLEKSSLFFKNFFINLFQFLHDHSLSLSVFLIAFEIIAGVALLLGWRMRVFSWLLLLLTIFFTFLTGYAFYSGKFTNCGCFGDCLPLSPKASFLKDLILTILIIFLFANRRRINPYFSTRTNFFTLATATVLSFGLQWYVLNYLPFADCLPFKTGNNISEKRRMPANAIPDSTVITFVYEKNGKKVEFTAENFPADFKVPPYKFITRYDKVVRKGKNNEPPIKGFVLRTPSGQDSTDIILSEPYCLLLFCENFSTPVRYWQKNFDKVTAAADKKGIPIYIVTASTNEASIALANTPFANIRVLECDFTVIRTAARTNPCLYLLKQGTVVKKWSYKTMSTAVNFLP
jgi:uncharacterized membrane protein YphA (DoxX/SURF4 family)